jgi:hypothetical protein
MGDELLRTRVIVRADEVGIFQRIYDQGQLGAGIAVTAVRRMVRAIGNPGDLEWAGMVVRTGIDRDTAGIRQVVDFKLSSELLPILVTTVASNY